MDFRFILADILLFCACQICVCLAQVDVIRFMSGSSPANPNSALTTCQNQATPKQLNVNRAGKYADHIYQWCSVYDDVLPCLSRKLPSVTSASDVYLQLIYNETMATRMSKSLCARFPHISNLTCVESGMEKVGQCMKWTVNSAIGQFNLLFKPGQVLTEDKRNLSSIYSCIIAVATSGCFHKELTTCAPKQRKLMYDFYIMLSGKCREIAGLAEITTTVPVITSTLTVESDIQSEISTSAPDSNTDQSTSVNVGETSSPSRINTASTVPFRLSVLCVVMCMVLKMILV